MKTISNEEIAKILKQISLLLDMQGVEFRPRAYEKAALGVESLEKSVVEIYKKGGFKALEEIPGVGKSIAEKIEELIQTGKIKYFEELKKEIPVNLDELSNIEGLGPKTIKKLYQELKIKNLADLEKAILENKIAKLEGFGEKSQAKLLAAIEFAKKSKGRFILGFIMPLINEIKERLLKINGVLNVTIAGSSRRQKETIGDLDILITVNEDKNKKNNIKKIMDFFVSMPEVEFVYSHGETKSAIKLNNGLDVDLRVVPKKSYGAALNYFTGSKEHNVNLRQIALKKRYKLNEYGLFLKTNEKFIVGETEEEIYKALGMQFIPPEMRENKGEIELALKNKLPNLINYNDLQGDLQVQTNWTDGDASIEKMANEAIKLGLKYIAITDHTKNLKVAGGLDEKRIQKQWQEIDKLNLKFKKQGIDFKILKGTECDILRDGSLDLPDKILSKLDVCGISIHSYFDLPEKEQTERIIKAISNPYADILFHPTCRIIQKRKPINANWEKIMEVAKNNGTILEIDAYPDRLDLNDELIYEANKKGLLFSIDSDAHSLNHFSVLKYGIGQARRGWVEKKSVINTWPLQKCLSFLKRSKKLK
jgi:DNA polymerase (family 10)